jgi:type I restriction enzyme M protein
MLASLKSDGKASVVLDTGAVSRGSGNKNKDKERDVRKAVVEKDWIEAVILLQTICFITPLLQEIIIIFN